MNSLLYPIILPFIFGTLCLFAPKKFIERLTILGSGINFLLTIWIFFLKPLSLVINQDVILQLDFLSRFILLAIGLFGFLIPLYSLRYMADKRRLREYYIYLLWTTGASCGAVLANNLILLLVFWGFLVLTLYLLIGIGGPQTSQAAKKTFIIVGGSDCLMLLGIALIYYLTGTFQMDKISLSLSQGRILLSNISYLCLVIASFAKAGAMPLHTWIPDCAEKAPIPVTAFLPASLDKLLGIYLLTRISINLFIMNKAMNIFLMIIGAVTILAAVMMALIQHDLKRLLSYHAVSQVGYMVLGIGTANPIGIAGGIFHMLNNAIYKGCLFLCGGAVEYRTKTTDLSRLGGLVRAMPITFLTCLISALSISGVPPFNGFVSKWMIYQSLIQVVGSSQYVVFRVLVLFCFLSAMFGSALTLASFMKVIHTTFLGIGSDVLKFNSSSGQMNRRRSEQISEVSWTMLSPMVILAGLCVIFGIFAYTLPLKYLILPSVSKIPPLKEWLGFWQPGLASSMIIIGIIIGGIIYCLGNLKGLRQDTSFVGGELIPSEHRVTGADFYNTIKDLRFLKKIYEKAEDKYFDIYDQSKRFVSFITLKLQYLHNGVLPTYLVWCLLGMAILFFILK